MGDLEFQTGRGCPLSPQAQVELTLAHLGGNTFQRTAGQSHNVARTARGTLSCGNNLHLLSFMCMINIYKLNFAESLTPF